ncbi:MAG: hypothetical protein WD577_01490 [Bacteroidales bacterium]
MKVKILIKKILYWALAFLITVGAAVFQRMTGPTHPRGIKFSVGEETYKIILPRSHGEETDCPVEITLPDQFTGEIVYRRFPTNEAWDTIRLLRVNKNLLAFLPQQPPAGKLEYHLNLKANGTDIDLGLEENIVIRFRGSVPVWVLMPHVLFMFLAMLWSNATGLLAAANIKSYRRNGLITVILFAIGGLILGPIVQKYAFGTYWTGWPLGEYLTDNKVLASFIIWTAALILNRKKERRWMIIAAAVILFVVYMIPHSMRGSELDFETGEVITGAIALHIIQLKNIILKPVCINRPL